MIAATRPAAADTPAETGAPALSAGQAFYLYAVTAAAPPRPPLPPAILPGAFAWLAHGPLAALVSRVPVAAFSGADAAARDPAWVSGRAAAHHAVVAALHAATPCLPLGFGTLFPGAGSLHAWLDPRAAAIARFLAGPAAHTEYVLQLGADETALGRWLQARLPALRQAAQAADTASPGRAVLLRKQLARLTEAACRAHMDAMSAAQQLHAERAGAAPEAEPPPHPAWRAWRLLQPAHRAPEDLLAPALAAACKRPDRITCPLDGQPEDDIAAPGLTVRLKGPFPPYGHARAALERA